MALLRRAGCGSIMLIEPVSSATGLHYQKNSYHLCASFVVFIEKSKAVQTSRLLLHEIIRGIDFSFIDFQAKIQLSRQF